MLKERTNDAPDDLGVATEALARVDGDVDVDVADLLARLERLGDALRATGGAYEAAAARVVPAARPLDRGIADRYGRAGAAWPAAPPPSHERFAAALASLHAAADAARLASRRCEDARRAIEALGGAAVDL
jgi:hypothetical protein